MLPSSIASMLPAAIASMLPALLLSAACGATAAGELASADAGEEQAVDGGQESGTTRAVVVSENGLEDSIRVLQSTAEGELLDNGIRLGPVDNPRRVAVRDDGREALIAYGRFAGEYGVVVIELEPDGSDASIKQNLVMGSSYSPFGVAYGDDDHALIAVANSGPDKVVAINRASSGDFEAGLETEIAGDYVIELRPIPGRDQVLLLRGDLLNTQTTEFVVYGRDEAGSWIPSSPGAELLPRSISGVASYPGADLFAPTSDPENPVTLDNLNPGGLLHHVSYTGPVMIEQAPFKLPGTASLIAASPAGDFLVLENPIRKTGGNISSYHLMTVALDEAGTPSTAYMDDDILEYVLTHDIRVTSAGNLLLAQGLNVQQAPVVDEQKRIVSFKQVSPGDWEPVGEPVFIQGVIDFALAP